MDYLAVDGHELPSTYEGWRALRNAPDQAPFAAISTAFEASLLMDVTGSKVVTTCNGALSVRTIGQRIVAPMSEVECLYGRFATPSARVKTLMHLLSA